MKVVRETEGYDAGLQEARRHQLFILHVLDLRDGTMRYGLRPSRWWRQSDDRWAAADAVAKRTAMLLENDARNHGHLYRFSEESTPERVERLVQYAVECLIKEGTLSLTPSGAWRYYSNIGVYPTLGKGVSEQ